MTAQTPSPRFRYLALDSYRFLAAMGIVCFHLQYDLGLPLGSWSRAFDKLYVYVDFFFVLSGFVIAEAYAGRAGSVPAYGRFLWRRLARIYPLHLATLLVLVAMVETMDAAGWLGARHAIFDRSTLPQNLALVHAWGTTPDQGWNLPSWSISAEWFVYLAFPALLLAANRLPAWGACLAAVAFVAAMHGVREALGMYHWTNATSNGAMRAVPTFFVGVAISRALARARSLPAVPWPLVHALFLAPLAALHLGAPDEVAIAFFPAVVALAALAERTGNPTRLASPAMVGLGHASYALYLVHFPVIFLAVHVLPPSSFPPASPWRFAMALAIALASVWLARLVHRRFELPAQAWLTRPLRRKEGPLGVEARAPA